ncbi:hypothetical protein O7602_29590 [Micromonospora sp. WMMD1128]|uniref:hypothetical protein n=1 Tax=Micromonospora sp. WMMD1128 TaxID=3015150 RepID=UPI00248AF264|nr:hypothetical protein [Micromonospora sp. WMMD1128]WBB73757.1 hypothetical protein O7602_29590 [Micromonospora sp. WMMD1128]
MSQDPPIPRQDSRSDGTTVVEWGDTDARSEPSGRVGRTLAGLGRDHRLPPVLAGLGAVAALASLIGEWVVIVIPDGSRAENAPNLLASGISETGGFGVAYLVGLLGLSVGTALALRGAPAVRQHARIAGLGLAAALLGVLVATASALQQVARRILFFPVEQSIQVEHGRGLITAFLAVVLLAATLHLTGRVGERAADPADDAPAHGPGGRTARRRGRTIDDDGPPAPADLTVEPTTPFAGPDRSR